MASNYFVDEETLPTEKERLEAPVVDLYSIIIAGVDHVFNPKTLKGKIVQKDNNGKPKRNRAGQLYLSYPKVGEGGDCGPLGLLKMCMSDVATPKENLASLNSMQKKALNGFKKFVNANQVALFWHNGKNDPSCEWNGLHLHCVVGILTNDGVSVAHCKTWRTVRKDILGLVLDPEVNSHPIVKTQKIKNHERMLCHLLSNPNQIKPNPRYCIGVNNMPLLLKLRSSLKLKDSFDCNIDVSVEDDYEKEVCPSETTDLQCDALGWISSSNVRISNENLSDDEDDYAKLMCEELPEVSDVITQTPKTAKSSTFDEVLCNAPKKPKNSESRIPESKTFKNTQILLDLCNKYKCFDKTGLFKAICDSEEVDGDNIDKSNYMQICCHPQQKMYWENALAMREMAMHENDETYLATFMQMNLTKDSTEMLSVEDTACLWIEWCKEQGLNPAEVALEIYMVLGKYVPKKNTFYLCGQSNAGKTFWVNSFIPEKSLIGEMISSSDFAFQECVNKSLILINELQITTPEQANMHKKVWEGEPYSVNIKMKNAQTLYRKPVIVTSNQPVWQMMTHERQPFLNRCFCHLNLRKSEVIEKFGKAANPKFWQELFNFMAIQFDTLEADPTCEISSYFDILDECIHTHIELMSKTEEPEIPETQSVDPLENDLSMERFRKVVEANNKRHGILKLPVKRKLNFDVDPEKPSTSKEGEDIVDGRQFLKATKLDVEDEGSGHAGGLSFKDRVSVFFHGGGSKRKMKAENLEMELEDSDDSTKSVAPAVLSRCISGDTRQTGDNPK